MSNMKKGIKSTFLNEELHDILNESEFFKNSTKNKKQTKRKRSEDIIDKDPAISITPSIPKQKKASDSMENFGELRQKIINIMETQFQTRKSIHENLHKGFTDVLNQMEADYNALKDNQQKLEHLTSSFLKCMQQATAAHKQKLKAFKEVHSAFKKECEEAEIIHKQEINKLEDDLEEDMNRFKEKLISDTKRNGWETLRRSFLQAMQNDY
ncbi:uncharacterized protein LOC121732351 [Aricia agestis]|uniref:uncharacterized protein LOC121732351 n=1 Tax=Aricia agestis TaxID=91739 RepID=UPI001C2062C2|nr:uncharacterized protein LOC121732351 [Aricia agestis]